MAVPGRQRNSHIAQTGRLVGGPLHGWYYAFLRFEMIDDKLRIHARCTLPKWPFPREVMFTPEDGDVRQFRAISGQRAKRIEADPLIIAAVEAAKQDQ